MKTLIQTIALLLALLATPLAAQSSWQISAGPGAISEHAMIRDTAHDRLIVFGGVLNGELSNRTFAYDAANDAWQELAPLGTAPSPRREPLAAYDAERNRMIVFGGDCGSGNTNDVFALDLTPGAEAWQQLATGDRVLPPVRTNGVMIVDAANDRAIVYGGYDYPNVLSDVWALSLELGAETWGNGELDTVNLPYGISVGNAAIYDPIGQRMLMFRSYEGKLYELSLGNELTWTDLTTDTCPQGMRRYPAVAYDPLRHEMILHGGLLIDTTYAETYSLDIDNMTWTRLADEPASNGRFWHTAAYDETRDRFVIVGGRDGARIQNSTMASLQLEIGVPELLSPIDGVVVEGETMSLAWAPAKGAQLYLFEILREDGQPISSEAEISVSGTTAVFTPHDRPLLGANIEVTYYWRVKGYNLAGSGEFSEYGVFSHVVSGTGPIMGVLVPGQSEERVTLESAASMGDLASSETALQQPAQVSGGAGEVPGADNVAGCASGNAGSGLALTLMTLLVIGVGLRKARKAQRD